MADTRTTPSALVGANVRAEMARAGVTQAQLGEAVGVTQSAISARLRGATPFDINELHAVAAFLDVAVTDLLHVHAKPAA